MAFPHRGGRYGIPASSERGGGRRSGGLHIVQSNCKKFRVTRVLGDEVTWLVVPGGWLASTHPGSVLKSPFLLIPAKPSGHGSSPKCGAVMGSLPSAAEITGGSCSWELTGSGVGVRDPERPLAPSRRPSSTAAFWLAEMPACFARVCSRRYGEVILDE